MSTTKILFEIEEATKVKAQEKAKSEGISLTAILVNALRAYNSGELQLGLRGPMIKHIDKHARKQKKDSWKDYLPEALRRMGAKELNTLNTIQIDSSQLLQNYRYLKEASHKTLFPVLKGNAYGHGIEQVTSILKDEKPEYYYVDSYYEGLRIREVDSSAKILIGGYVSQENISKLHLDWATLVISDLSTLRKLASLNKECRVHLKINTGMNRAGIQMEELDACLHIFESHEKMNLEGVCTHFADADNSDMAITNVQIDRFHKSLQSVHNAGFVPKFTHMSNSAGLFKESVGNAARPGIALYGINPLSPVDMYSSYFNPIAPCMRVTAKIVNLKDISKGQGVSYCHSYTASRDMSLGVVSFGYHEGLPRSLSNAGVVTVRGKSCPIVGRVCMNHTVIDLSEVSSVTLEDEVVILSGKKDGANSIYEMASMQGTIPYEVCTRLDPSVRRIIL